MPASSAKPVKPLVAVIEDDAASSEALCFILRDWGADVVADVSAANLMRQLGARAAQLSSIIADYDLGPAEDGITGARVLRAMAPKARVLVLSGVLSGRGAATARDAGFDVLAKPARPAAIIDWLEQA